MAEQRFTLTSPAFRPGDVIPRELTCDGDDGSPELNWSHPPEEAQSYALIVEDPDAPKGIFTHWILFDIPADTMSLPADTHDVGLSGRNDFQNVGYGGPCPPSNHGPHRYFFKLFALDLKSLDLKAGATRQEVVKAMEGHIVGQAELMGRYQRAAG